MTSVADADLALFGVESQHELAALEHHAVGLAEHGHQQLAVQLVAQAFPIDVEEARVHRCMAVLQHVLPPGVVGAEHADVIRDDVEHLSHAVLPQRGAQPVEIGTAADLGIKRVVIDDIVAVQAPRARFEIR